MDRGGADAEVGTARSCPRRPLPPSRRSRQRAQTPSTPVGPPHHADQQPSHPSRSVTHATTLARCRTSHCHLCLDLRRPLPHLTSTPWPRLDLHRSPPPATAPSTARPPR
ncbi:hypothetical protein BS78_K332700 [Paspalum vaginatum]|uniref:Uncharacterized protein n=1 Tax=Paspalum vaginatum TaxID=158149 RepID=A0A9W8CFX9_9POAL|nr:hypothetical protein BS78_K332700 [Paspalum vaginatum]